MTFFKVGVKVLTSWNFPAPLSLSKLGTWIARCVSVLTLLTAWPSHRTGGELAGTLLISNYVLLLEFSDKGKVGWSNTAVVAAGAIAAAAAAGGIEACEKSQDMGGRQIAAAVH